MIPRTALAAVLRLAHAAFPDKPYVSLEDPEQLAFAGADGLRFVKMCAARTGQLLNLSALAADCGISHVTAREWLTVLEASYLVRLLPPYHRNFGKRLVKTPKLYFLDVGLAAWLLGIRDARRRTSPART